MRLSLNVRLNALLTVEGLLSPRVRTQLRLEAGHLGLTPSRQLLQYYSTSLPDMRGGGGGGRGIRKKCSYFSEIFRTSSYLTNMHHIGQSDSFLYPFLFKSKDDRHGTISILN